jgi:Fe-S-cluster formation regulator IscX/YfhJ
MAYLEEMVISLPDFEEHDAEASEYDLKRILEAWIEVRGA